MKSIRMPIILAMFVSVTVLGCASQSNTPPSTSQVQEIDSQLLRGISMAFGERRGHVVVLEVDSGRVQANASINSPAAQSYPNTTRILLSHGLSPLHPAKQYPISETPLRLAVQLEEAEVVPLLMAAIPSEQLGHTAVIESVWIAAGFEKTAILKALLDAGASPNYIARQGGTALIEAVNDRNLDAVRLLLKHGATVDDHLYRGKSVFQYAEQQAERDSPKAREILELIRQAPKVDRGWQKSRDTQVMEDIWQMIENPEKFKGKPAP